MDTEEKYFAGGMVLMIAMMVGSFGAWITHVVSCLANDAWGFLIAGAICFPVGIIHGVYLWLT